MTKKRKRDICFLDSSNHSTIPSSIRAWQGENELIFTLPNFVKTYAPSLPSLALTDCDESDRIRRTIIVPSSTLLPFKGIHEATRSQSLVDLIDGIIWTLVERKSRTRSQSNVLSRGYSFSSVNYSHVQHCPNMRPGVICTHINDNVNFWKTSSYAESLHRLLGDDLLRIMILNSTIFLPVDGSPENYILLSGETICSKAKGKKRRKNKHEKSISKVSGNNENDFIPRLSLFYNQSYVPKIGFQKNHVMDQGNPVRLLSAMVNLYHTKQGRKPTRRRKRWTRLRELAIPICEEVLRRHARFDYARTLNRICPLPEVVLSKKKSIAANPKPEVNLAEVGTLYSPTSAVVVFLFEVVRHVFPIQFWGSEHNLNCVLKMLETFVNLRRDERFPNKVLIQGLRVTDFAWLWSLNDSNSKTSHEAATVLLEEVMRWILCGFTIPLLRSIFYVTESEFSAKRILYYRKPVWSLFRTLSIRKLGSNQFQEISHREVATLLANQKFGLSRLKLLPKTTGVRPIAMLSKCDTLVGNSTNFREASTNKKLASAFQVVRYEYERNPALFGAGKAGLNDIYHVFKSFLSDIRLKKQPWKKKTDKKLFIVSVDIQKCYDNVHQGYLQTIMEDVFQEDHYLIQRHSVFHPFSSLGRHIWKSLSLVGGLTSFERFHNTASRLSPGYTNSIFCHDMLGTIIKKTAIMSQIKQHLQCNIVAMPGRYEKRFFIQKSGIPQGSVLSSFLCNFYYGRLENELITKRWVHQEDQNSLLLRLMDDFLLITTDSQQARDFLMGMRRGIPELGVCINKDKSRSNLMKDNKSILTLSGNRSYMSWCGLLINTRTGEVQIDYRRFPKSTALDSLTIERYHVGRNLVIRMKTFVRPRCQPLLFDSGINSFEVVVVNFTQMMLLAAVKSFELIQTVVVADQNIRFLREAITSTVRFARNLIIHRLKKKSPSDSFLRLGSGEALWLGQFAFLVVLKRLDIIELQSKSIPENKERRLNVLAQQALKDYRQMTTPDSKCRVNLI
jgi:telomerase reverse transcriptase